MEHLKRVSQVLRENQLYVKRVMCDFSKHKVYIIGHIMSHGKLKMDETKFKEIQGSELPTKVTELRSFLRLANYYSRFFSGYSTKSASLTELLNKNKPWVLS